MLNQKLSGRRVMNLRLAVVAGLALGLAGCTNDFAKNGTSDAVLLVAAINGGAPLVSDVSDGGTVVADNAVVVLAARSKNIRFNEVQYTRGFQIVRYEIRYYRSDGRNVEGVDVPYRIAGNINAPIDIGEDNLNLPVEVVRAQAKLEPPLRNLVGGGGALIMTCFAEITIYGQQLATGDIAEAKGNLQIDFADYAE